QWAFLAYLNCSEPSERIKPAPGVFLEFAPIRRCYLHAIDDPSCEINRKFYHDLQRLLEVFDPAQSHILEYHMDSSYFSRYNKPAVKVVFSEKILRRDLEAYTALGIRNFTSFAVYMDGEYFKNYGDEDLVAYAKILNEHL
ncbi:MAG: hypothetical protein GX564_08410, partial [Oligosphaeraceae bacterium]|nr:hypothetical protein [Oligosphaeraceae bacterium]